MDDTSSSRSSPTPSERRRVVALVHGPKGLKGGVRVELLTDWPEDVAPGVHLYAEDGSEVWHVERVEAGGRTPVLYLEGVTTREAAEALSGRYLEADPRSLDAGSYFWDDLIGLAVEGPTGERIGEVVEIFRAGGNEVYRVVGPAGERLVPALHSAIAEIDIASGRLVLTGDEAEEVR
jgi:16S rRNA processing protein RimM